MTAVDTPEITLRLQAGVPPALALLAGLQLEVFSALGEEALTANETAARLGVEAPRLDRLLRALVLTGLLELNEGRFRNGAEAARFLVKGRPGYIGGSHELIADIWAGDLLTATSIREARSAALHDFSHMDQAALQRFLRGLVPYALATGRALAKSFPLPAEGSVVDVGGGSGGALIGMMERQPSLTGMLFDLPPVIAAARDLVAPTEQAARIRLEAGDILAGPPPGQHDAVLLRALVQVLDPVAAALAIRHAAACLKPGGRLFITGSGILDDGRLSPEEGVYLNLTLMNFYPGGTAYTEGEHRAWLLAAGCRDPQRAALASGTTLFWATRAG